MITRRQFLAAAGTGAAAACGGCVRLGDVAATAPPLPPPEQRKLVVVVFGGGTRSSEAIDDPRRRYIPRLWMEMVPRGTLFTNLRVEGPVVHPNSTGSIVTGHWEWEHLDWDKPLAHPSIFEIARRERKLPDTKAWAFVYASILAKAGESSAPGYGLPFAANVVEPPTIPRATAEEMDRAMALAAAEGKPDAGLAAAARCAKLARDAARISTAALRSDAARRWVARRFADWKESGGTTSHDAFLASCAIDCMEAFAPDVTVIAFGEIDCAHYGSWSRYVEAIRRTDELTWRIRRSADELPAYRGRTLMLVLPDHGRELERPGGAGFLHHGDFYANTGADEGCRRVWMLALGPGVPAGRIVERPAPITSAAATGLEFLGLKASDGAAGAALRFLPAPVRSIHRGG